jgi:hypothetical protein
MMLPRPEKLYESARLQQNVVNDDLPARRGRLKPMVDGAGGAIRLMAQLEPADVARLAMLSALPNALR